MCYRIIIDIVKKDDRKLFLYYNVSNGEKYIGEDDCRPRRKT